jgi:dTDP-4-amino-4,6-dideoxygalactose transaminase
MPYTFGDLAAGLAAMLGDGPASEDFPLFRGVPKFWTSSGRQALRLLLESLDLKPGSGIAIPLFTDPSLFKAIVAAGHQPVFIDIDPRFLTLDPGSLERAHGRFSAVVAVHLFGQLADVPAILDVARGRPVIEDAAHAPLSYIGERVAGSFGAATFYSFASTKYWPAGGGGLAVVNDAKIAARLREKIPTLAPPPWMRELRNLFLQAAKTTVFSRQLYGICGKPLRRWAEHWALLEPSLDLNAVQRPWAAVACRQALRMADRVARQRANSLRLLDRIGGIDDLVLPQERSGSRYNYHLFPVLLRDCRERGAITAELWSRFVDTSTIYSDVLTESARFGYMGGCPIAESVAIRLITLPNYAALKEREIDNIAELFRAALRDYRSKVAQADFDPSRVSFTTPGAV